MVNLVVVFLGDRLMLFLWMMLIVLFVVIVVLILVVRGDVVLNLVMFLMFGVVMCFGV